MKPSSPRGSARALSLLVAGLAALALAPAAQAAPALVTDISPGGGGESFPGSGGMVLLGGAVYFDADDGTNGYELGRTDGTPGGTVMVKDIEVGGEGGERRRDQGRRGSRP